MLEHLLHDYDVYGYLDQRIKYEFPIVSPIRYNFKSCHANKTMRFLEAELLECILIILIGIS